MNFRPAIQGKTAAILEKEALHYGVTGTALVKAIVETVVREGIVHETLAGVDVESFAHRKRGRPKMKLYEYRGDRVSLADISGTTGIPASVIRSRLRVGWDMERAATTAVGRVGNPNWGRADQ